MKKIISFSKGFLPCAIISLVVIAFGIFGFFTKGINLALDFKPGLIEEVRLSDPAMSIVYSGAATATVDVNSDALTLVISGTGAENKTIKISYSDHPTIADIAAGLNEEDDIVATVLNDESATVESFWMFLNSDLSTVLKAEPLFIYGKNKAVTIDEVRDSLKDIDGVALKELGEADTRSFQIRMAAKSDEDSNQALKSAITSALRETFGDNSVVVTKADYIGAGFSKTLAQKSLLLLLATIVLIWAYAAFRFHWDFALGSVIALVHDTLIMFTFIIWSRMEFGTTVLAAVLTIIGYSINATVVILDRVRFNLGTIKVTKFSEVLNSALSDTLRRSIITTLTTLFAVISLFVFTTGSIKDFACALIVGLISGCYSSIFISSGFIDLLRIHWKPEFGIHHSEKSVKRGELDLGGVTV